MAPRRVLLFTDGGMPHSGPHGQRWWHIFDANYSELRDLVTDGSGPDKTVLRTVLDDQRLASALAVLAPAERALVRAWAYGGAPTWQEAADPAEFGERVRRTLRRQGREYLRRRTAATDAGLCLPPQAISTVKEPI